MTILDRHNLYDDPISSRAVCASHVRSYVAKPTWQNYDEIISSWLKISPVHFGGLYGPSSINSAFLYIFRVNSCQLHGLSPIVQPFKLFGSAIYIYLFSFLIFCQLGPNRQILLGSGSILSDSVEWVTYIRLPNRK